jgi:hypothetical protein
LKRKPFHRQAFLLKWQLHGYRFLFT